MATTTNTLGTLQIASVTPVGDKPTDTVKITTAYIRDWEAILSDVVAAINFRSEFMVSVEIESIEYTNDRDVIVTFTGDGGGAAKFLQFVDTLGLH